MKPQPCICNDLGSIQGWLFSSVGASAAPEAKMSDLSQACVRHRRPPRRSASAPAGPSKFDPHQKRGVAFKSAPPPIDAKKRNDDLKPVNPDELKKYAERDTRKTRLQARARALLIAEIQGLERLFRQTKKNSPDRPQLVRRLAEGYVELEAPRSATRSRRTSRRRTRRPRSRTRPSSGTTPLRQPRSSLQPAIRPSRTTR